MVNAMARELRLRSAYLNDEIETIYFGGGTPSLLSVEELKFLLDQVYAIYPISGMPEITLEANPDDLTYLKLKSLHEVGVNRLSIGIQSFDDSVLRFLNRAHDSRVARQCLNDSRTAGFNNISIDLIYAIPGQKEEVWSENIRTGLDTKPEHISAYALTIEEKTAFGRWAAKGKLKPVDDDLAANQMEILVETLEQHGYEQYEVSNFAKPGFSSRHNSAYWKGLPYLGIGPSAHSYNIHSRQFNVKNNHEYLRQLNRDQLPATVEVLTVEEKVNDYLLTTLRTNWGADLMKIKSEYTVDLLSVHQNYIENLVENGLAVFKGSHLILTRRGRFLADKISADLFIPN